MNWRLTYQVDRIPTSDDSAYNTSMGILKPVTSSFLILIALSSSMAIANEGQILFETQCIGCHQLGSNAYGPNLCGLLGRKAGTAPGYPYSKPMKDSGIIWNNESLGRFLQSPQTVVPGTRMGIIGFEDKRQRKAIASYLLQAKQTSACLKFRINNNRQ